MTVRQLLAVTTSFPLRHGACPGVFVRHLYRNLPAHWRVAVVCPDDAGGSGEEKQDEARSSVYPVGYAPRTWRVLAQQSGGVMSGLRQAPWRAALVPALLVGLAWRSMRLARQADLIHANWAICGTIAGIVGKYMHRPVVTTFRGDDIARAGKSRLERLLLDIAVRHSVAIVCVSEAMAAQLQSSYPQRIQDIHVCLNGIDDAFLRVQPPPRQRAECLRIVSVGSLIQRKGYDLLIEAVARMQHRGSLTVKIVGEGPERMRLSQRAASLGIADRLEFVGEVPPEQIPKFLEQADIFVLPSRSEGRPNVVIEALTAGLPVVCSDLPGVEGLVQHGINGWLVRIDDVDAIARALDEAAADPEERARRALAAYERMRSFPHTWRDTGSCYDALFENVLQQWHARNP